MGDNVQIDRETRLNEDGTSQEVRVFTNPVLQSAIDSALTSVDPDKKGVILEVDMPEMGEVRGVVAARLNNHWSVGLVGEYTGRRGVSGGARVAFQW